MLSRAWATAAEIARREGRPLPLARRGLWWLHGRGEVERTVQAGRELWRAPASAGPFERGPR